MKTIPPSPTPNSFVQFSEAQTKPNHPTSKSVSQRELFVQSRLLPAHVVTSRGNLACWSTTSLLPDRPYVLVDHVELCDEGAGGGQVQEALVIHIQHLDSWVE